MDIKIDALHFEASNGLQSYVIEKVEKLEHIYDRIENCRVILKVEPAGIAKNKVVEIIVNVQQKNRLFAKECAENFDLAVVAAVDDIKRQLIRFKNMAGEHRPGRGGQIDQAGDQQVGYY